MHDITCTHCGQTLEVSEAPAGITIACPVCHGTVQIPPAGGTPLPPALPKQAGGEDTGTGVEAPTAKEPGTSGPSIPSGKVIAIIAGSACLFALIIAAMCGAVYLSNQYYQKRAQAVASQRHAEEKAANGLVDDLRKVVVEMRELQGNDRESTVRMKTGGPATNDVERIREVLGTFMNDLMALQNEYQKALSAAGIERILDPVRFQQDTTFEETQKLLSDCRMLVVLHRQKGLNAMDSFPTRVEAMNFSENTKQQILKNFAQGTAQSRPLFKQIWDIELATADEMAALCNHLHASRSAWTLQNSQFLFDHDADLKIFNEHLQKIESNVQKQEELRQSSIDQAAKKLDGYKF